MWKRRASAFLVIIILVMGCAPTVSAQEDVKLNQAEQYISDGLFGTEEEEGENDGPGWPVNKMIEGVSWFLGDLVTGFIEALGLADPGQLIFNNSTAIGKAVSDTKDKEKASIYNTFTPSTWKIIDTFYEIVRGTIIYLLVVALAIWGFLFVFRSESTLGQYNIGEMLKGFVTFFVLMLGMSYFIELFFTVNDLMVKWAKSVVGSFNLSNGVKITADGVSFLNIILAATGTKVYSETNLVLGTIALLVILLIMVVIIGLINYQYAVRMVSIGILIIIYPIVAFASIFPARQKAFDLWAREFASQVFMNGAHAIIWAFFLLLLYNKASFWILIPMLFSIPALTSLVRIMFGAQMPSGTLGAVGGAMGAGTVMAVTSMVRSLQGKGTAKGGSESVIKGTGGSETGKGENVKALPKTRSTNVAGAQNRAGFRHAFRKGMGQLGDRAKTAGKLMTAVGAGTGAGMMVAAATGDERATGTASAVTGLMGLAQHKPELPMEDADTDDIPLSDKLASDFNHLNAEQRQELQRLFPNVNFEDLEKKTAPLASKLAKQVQGLTPEKQKAIQELFPRVQFNNRSPNAVASQLASEYRNASPDIQKQLAHMIPALNDYGQLPEKTQSRIAADLLNTDSAREDVADKAVMSFKEMTPEQQQRAVHLIPSLKEHVMPKGQENAENVAEPTHYRPTGPSVKQQQTQRGVSQRNQPDVIDEPHYKDAQKHIDIQPPFPDQTVDRSHPPSKR